MTTAVSPVYDRIRQGAPEQIVPFVLKKAMDYKRKGNALKTQNTRMTVTATGFCGVYGRTPTGQYTAFREHIHVEHTLILGHIREL